MNLQIIGLGGTNGSGKDTVGEMFTERHGYLFVSVTDMLREELNNRGLPIERKNMAALSAEWRRDHGFGVLIDKAVEHYQKQPKKYKGLIMASLRHPAEADAVHKQGGSVIWVDADPKVRYDRIQANAQSRNRAGEDNKSFEEFMADEEREMHPEGDEATLNMAGVKENADITLVNNGNNIDTFKNEAEEALGLKTD